MSILVKLSNIIDGIQFQSDMTHSYLNIKTGEVVTVTDEEFTYAENELPLAGVPDWQLDSIQTAKDILESTDYLQLPDRFDIDEYRIMERFCLGLDDADLREEMCYAIHGKGAFSRFKNNIHRYGLAEKWYQYRDQAIKQSARDWCEANEIAYAEE